MKVLNVKGLTQNDLDFLSKNIGEFWDEHGLPERTVRKVIARHHVLFASASFILKPYEIMAVKEHNFRLVYQHEGFNEFMRTLAWKKGLPGVEKHFKCKVERYYSSEAEFSEDCLKREICIVFSEKLFAAQPDFAIKAKEEERMLAFAKKLRLKTSRGPKKSRVMILDAENTIYEIYGWLSENERENLLKEGEERKNFVSVIKKVVSEVIFEIEAEEGFQSKKLDIDINPKDNHLLVISYKD